MELDLSEITRFYLFFCIQKTGATGGKYHPIAPALICLFIIHPLISKRDQALFHRSSYRKLSYQ